MHSLITRLRSSPTPVKTRLNSSNAATGKRPPHFSQRQKKAPYYFDASKHTSLSIRLLLEKMTTLKTSPQLRNTQNFLCLTMDNLLQSIRPGIDDDAQSRQYFFALLRMHLSHLTADELKQLEQTLKTTGFGCNVTETIIDDQVYRDYGFANGPPHSFNRTLMQTPEFFSMLNDLQHSVQELQSRPLKRSLADATRAALSACASHWSQSEKMPEDLNHSLCLLGQALNLPNELTGIISGTLNTKASTVAIAQQILMIDSATAEAMATDPQDACFTEVLRDVLELLLTQKIFGIAVPPDKLTQRQRQDLFAAMETIYQSAPPGGDPALATKARAVLQQAHDFGEVQIQPTTGVALGHAWIAPSLSLVPDKRKVSVDIGHRFMHSGIHLEPGDSHIREWPAHFMTAKENEESYPSDHGWQVRVPVDSHRLQVMAQEVRREWESLDLPYRFTGTAPGIRATGCRVTVWEAVQRGMTADARELFDHYNRGLPDPQSPTELWQRLDGLMRWMETLAAG